MHALTAHLENGRSSPELRSAWPVALPRSPTTAVLVWGVGTAEIGIANGIELATSYNDTLTAAHTRVLAIDD